MNLKRLNRQTDAWLFMLLLLLVTIVTSDMQDCGDGYITISVNGECTNTTCNGECRNEDTCCLEKCFSGNQPTAEELAGCFIDTDAKGGCSFVENQTECLAGNVNKTFGVCWKHIVYFIASHPDAERITGFNPVHCPCEIGYTRKTGPCSFQQCVNGPYCEEKHDFILDTDVCCLRNGIFPQEDDCDDTEKLENSVHKHLNVDTVAQCQTLCKDGLCKMPNVTRLPACCRKIPEKVKNKDGGGLHGGVTAVIVIISVVLALVAIFGVFYLYRIKKEESQLKRSRNGGSVIEVTGVEEIQEEHVWDENDATYPNGYDNAAYEDSDKYIQSRDEYDHVSVPDFSARVHSLDKLQNGNVHGYESRGYFGDNERSDEERSVNHYRTRGSGSSNPEEFGTNADSIQYVFDDGKDVSDDNAQYGFDDDKDHSSEEDDHKV